MGVAQKRPETQYRTRHARSLWLLGSIVLLWLVGVAFLANAWVIGIILAVPGLLALALCARQALKGRWGSATAWVGCSLGPLALLGIFALANIHLHEFTGTVGSGCDPMAQSCDPQVGQGMAHALSLVTFMAVGIITLRLLAIERETHS